MKFHKGYGENIFLDFNWSFWNFKGDTVILSSWFSIGVFEISKGIQWNCLLGFQFKFLNFHMWKISSWLSISLYALSIGFWKTNVVFQLKMQTVWERGNVWSITRTVNNGSTLSDYCSKHQVAGTTIMADDAFLSSGECFTSSIVRERSF